MKKTLLAVWLLWAGTTYADNIVVINTPTGGQTVCVMQGGYVVCY